MQPVIPYPRVEPAFGLAHPDDAVLWNAKPRHAFLVSLHMRLAEKPAGHAILPQMIAKRGLADADGKLVPAGSMACHIAARIGRHAAGPADRRLDIGVGKADTARGHPVKIGGVQGLVPGTAQIIEP